MASIASTLVRIKQELGAFLPDCLIRAACQEAGHVWRERILDPVTTIHVFVQQLLHGNTAMTDLRHLSKLPVKAAAYCRARIRLPLEVLEKLLLQSSAAMRQSLSSAPVDGQSGGEGGGANGGESAGLWCGLRAYLVDGSSTIAPDTESSQKAFGQSKNCKKGCGFPVPKLLGLFCAYTGLIVQVMCFPLYTHEQSKVWMLHPLLGLGDLLVGDRGFCSFVHLAMLSARKIQGLFRIHQATIVDFRPHRKHRTGQHYRCGRQRGRMNKRQQKQARHRKRAAKKKPLPRSRFIKRLGRHDQIVEWFKPGNKPKWMNQKQFDQLPESLPIRELRFKLPQHGQRTLCVTIATTLLDPVRYPKEKIAELYGVRWRVETHFAQLKTILKMRKVKGKSADVVKKELLVYALVYNLVHAVMLQAAQRQHVTPDRISFIDALRWLRSALPGEELPDLLVNRVRPNRHEPRVVKDRANTYTKMTRPRAQLRKQLKKQAKSLK
jgi:hypothetical protein